MYNTLNKADALLIVTEWPEFRSPDFEEMKKRLNQPLIFDGRNVFDSKDMQEIGFDYYCIGIRKS
jgi:UDPglucose 6-dehydrogenase